MSDAQTVERWTTRNEFLLRRLHSLSGIVPIGVFLITHLYTNSLAALQRPGEQPGQLFNEHVRWLHEIPFLPLIEFLFIFLPLAFHAGYGIVIARTGRSNVQHYGYADNWRYTLQRVTGWIAVFFIAIHLLHFRFAYLFNDMEFVGHPDPFGYMSWGFTQILPPAIWYAVYALGLTATVYHFCNGICTFCITWGITVGDRARKGVSVAAGGLAIVLMIWGIMALWAIGTKSPADTSFDRADATRPVQVHSES